MKGKFRILRRIGLGVFLVCALMVALMPVAPVSAATAVTNVYVEFPFTDAINATSDSDSSNIYIVHFKTTTAMTRGVDWVTVTFPDGTETMSGTAGTAYAFTLATGGTKLVAADVLFSTDYHTTDLINTASWYRTTSDPTVGGKRAKVKLPIDIAAGTDVWVKFDDASDGGAITTSTGEVDTYKVYVSTTQDTTPVLSSTFSLGAATYIVASTAMESSYPVPTTAGATGEYIVKFTPAHQVTGASGKVTLKFPVGTVLPSSISATEVQFKITDGSYSPCSETPVVDTDRRMITAIPSINLTTVVCYIKVLSAAGITNPTTADSTTGAHYTVAVRTSTDRQWEASGAFAITSGSANKVLVGNGEIGAATTLTTYYSDDATMINMWSSQIYVVLADVNGNGLTPSSSTTLNVSSSSTTGSFANNDAAAGTGTITTGVTSTTIDTSNSNDPAHANSLDDQIFYYKDSTAGTHTLTFKASGYADATWEITVCPGVSVYDASNNLVKTYAPLTTDLVDELGADTPSAYTQYYSGNYLNSAISGALAGDTVKLGDGIYEIDTSISLNKKITLTSVNGASSTTIRSTTNLTGATAAIVIGTDGTSSTPVIIDGFTIQRLRNGTEIEVAVYNFAYDYVTVRNCTFKNIYPTDQRDVYDGSVIVWWNQTGLGTPDNITSATVSNNTFIDCGSETWPYPSGAAKTGIITFHVYVNSDKTYTGVTISGNTLTDCNGYGITVKGDTTGGSDDDYYVTASITNNTITNGYSSINISGATRNVSITGNTITGAYAYGIKNEHKLTSSLTIKNNTITGQRTGGTHGTVRIEYWPDDPTHDTDTTGGTPSDYTHYIQYNDIYDNNCPAIEVDSRADQTITASVINCSYNWFGDASGPAYTAATGATVLKSNPNGTGDAVTDRVFYYPWLYKPLADVVADNVSWQTSVMKLVAGWNTLSTPVPLIAAADTVDELIPSGMSVGYYYDGGWQQITTGYTLSPCDAVYVKMDEAKYVQLKFECETFSTPSKDLAVGWNLISLASLASSGMYDQYAVASVYKDSANLPGYGQVISPSLNANRYDMYYNAGTSWAFSSGQSATNYMYAGLGYWCYMQNAATLAGFEITPIAPDLD